MPTRKSSGAKTWIDPDDAPRLTQQFFERAEIRDGERLVRRGRPKVENPKEPVSIRLSREVLAHFRAAGPGWQTRINEALERAVSRVGKKRK